MPTHIEWTDEVWNPIHGCKRCSDACDNCYAAVMTQRLAGMEHTKGTYAGLVVLDKKLNRRHFNGEVITVEAELTKPTRWRKGKRIFTCSMSDVFYHRVPVAFRRMMFEVMRNLPRHTFQVLTKRVTQASKQWYDLTGRVMGAGKGEHIRFGATLEHQDAIDKHADAFMDVCSPTKFVSIEPMLSHVQLPLSMLRMGPRLQVIVGGESGPRARPLQPDWVRSIRDQCTSAGVAFFFKQWGEWAPSKRPVGRVVLMNGGWMRRVGKKKAGRVLDRQTWNGEPKLN